MRVMRMAALAALVAGSAIISNQAATAQPAQWLTLGCRDVAFNVDRDAITVGRDMGRFSAIRLRASGNAVEMLDLKVIYASGAADDIPVRAIIRPGVTSGSLDLRGARERAIQRIELIYRAIPNNASRAAVCADGLQFVAEPGPGAGNPQFTELGCANVGFKVDRDVIRVGRREGTFKAIRIRVAQNPIEMLDLTVVYGNGSRDDVPVRANLLPGRGSGWLDLRGGDRVIESIELVYRNRPGFAGTARVCIDGRF